jgi:choline dehydrogenase
MRIFDHIVIGAGSAGCAVAARLSEDANRDVLLIEAGPTNRRLDVRIPAAFPSQFHNRRVDWDYFCEPEDGLAGRGLYQPRARMLGGCSSMNAMLYIRGNPTDYATWVEQGAKGWSYDEVLPFFKKSEHNEQLRDRFHGTGGPLNVTVAPSPDPLSHAFVDAAIETGVPANHDFNGEEQEGAGLPQVTQRNGMRWDAATAFLTAARDRPNLTIVTRALVNRLVIEKGRAVGVDLVRMGRPRTVRSRGDIVISAGAFGTPEILQRSGIGPSRHLRSVGVEPIVDLPAVGANLMDHPLVGLHHELTGGARGLHDVPWILDQPRPRYLTEWLRHRTGPLSSNIAEAVAHVRSNPALSAPDLQLLMAPGYFYKDGTEKHPVPAATMLASLIGPQSRGSVLIRSADPRHKAAVRLNFFAEPADLDAIVRGLEILRGFAAAGPLRRYLAREFRPGPQVADRAALAEFVRRECEHTFHPSGTVRMGGPDDAALDPQLRVYGVDGLRVADTSVFPTIPHGNTNAPAIMVGERCADFIRNPA